LTPALAKPAAVLVKPAAVLVKVMGSFGARWSVLENNRAIGDLVA
jgi:hypothetical protein